MSRTDPAQPSLKTRRSRFSKARSSAPILPFGKKAPLGSRTATAHRYPGVPLSNSPTSSKLSGACSGLMVYLAAANRPHLTKPPASARTISRASNGLIIKLPEDTQNQARQRQMVGGRLSEYIKQVPGPAIVLVAPGAYPRRGAYLPLTSNPPSTRPRVARYRSQPLAEPTRPPGGLVLLQQSPSLTQKFSELSRTNVCTRRKRTCGPKEEVRV